MQKDHKRISCPSGDGSYWTIQMGGVVPVIEHHTPTGKVDRRYDAPTLRYAPEDQLPAAIEAFAEGAAFCSRSRRDERRVR